MHFIIFNSHSDAMKKMIFLKISIIWINRLKEKLNNLSEFAGRSSGNNKWIQMSLTPECRWSRETKLRTHSGDAITWIGYLLSSPPSTENGAAEVLLCWCGTGGQRQRPSLFEPKALPYFSGNWCSPRNGLAQLWLWVFWNISPVSGASGPSGLYESQFLGS